jgi:hypothetical protein
VTEIVEFIEAQLDIDEQIARSAPDGPWGPQTEAWPESPEARVWAETATGREVQVAEANGVLAAAHIGRHDPVRVLADVEAERAIVAECDEVLNATREDGSFVHHPSARVGPAASGAGLVAHPGRPRDGR